MKSILFVKFNVLFQNMYTVLSLYFHHKHIFMMYNKQTNVKRVELEKNHPMNVAIESYCMIARQMSTMRILLSAIAIGKST